jgi:hypothetical protein
VLDGLPAVHHGSEARLGGRLGCRRQVRDRGRPMVHDRQPISGPLRAAPDMQRRWHDARLAKCHSCDKQGQRWHLQKTTVRRPDKGGAQGEKRVLHSFVHNVEHVVGIRKGQLHNGQPRSLGSQVTRTGTSHDRPTQVDKEAAWMILVSWFKKEKRRTCVRVVHPSSFGSCTKHRPGGGHTQSQLQTCHPTSLEFCDEREHA